VSGWLARAGVYAKVVFYNISRAVRELAVP
jgi:hypothetical protein